MAADENHRVFIGLGSNLGDGPETLLMAWELLGREKKIRRVAISSPYVSAPVDMQSQHWFTNAVAELRTALSPEALLARLMVTEAALGRVRDEQSFGHQDRTIDLDILYFGDLERDDPDLVLPHPHIQERLFVLAPLAEIAPDFIDCRQGQSVLEMHRRLVARMEDGTVRRQEISTSNWPE